MRRITIYLTENDMEKLSHGITVIHDLKVGEEDERVGYELVPPKTSTNQQIWSTILKKFDVINMNGGIHDIDSYRWHIGSIIIENIVRDLRNDVLYREDKSFNKTIMGIPVVIDINDPFGISLYKEVL